MWNSSGTLSFHKAGGSSIITNDGEEKIQVVTIDEFLKNVDSRVDMIKLDTEGAEKEIIEGAKYSIAYFKPKLQISVYHKAEDLWDLILQIYKINPYYKFYLGHHSVSIIETCVYAICD